MGLCCGKKRKAAHSSAVASPNKNTTSFTGLSGSGPGASGDINFKLVSSSGKKRKKTNNNSKMSLIHAVQDKDDFTNQLKEAGSKLVVVDFYATWCGPCKMIAPKLEEFAQQMPDVVFLKVDVDDCEEVASEFNISCMPTFTLMKNSEKVGEFSGANAEKLKELIESHK